MEFFKRFDWTRTISLIAAVAIALASIFLLSPILSRPGTYKNTIQYLDEKESQVIELVEGSASLAFLISMINDDTGTPVANEISKFTEYFLIALVVILLEKYSLTVFGVLVSYLGIPILAIGGWYAIFFARRRDLQRMCVKFGIFVIVMLTIVPGSTALSKLIESTHVYSVASAVETSKEASIAAADVEEDGEDNRNIFQKIGDAIGKAIDGVSGAITWIKDGMKQIFEAVAVLLVTSCLIPILVAVVFVKTLNFVFKLSLSTDKLTRRPAKHK